MPHAGFFSLAAWWMTCFWWLLAHNITDLLLALAPAAFPQVAIHRSSMSLVSLSTPLATSTCVLLESFVNSSRHNDRCTHGIVVKFQTSCCPPFSVVTKK